MRILLHMCCGPCAVMPVRELLRAGHEVAGWFYNPNIHPLAEYLRRREGAKRAAEIHGIPLLFPDAELDAKPDAGPDAGLSSGPDRQTGFTAPEYDVESWCRAALAHPQGRCFYCRASRFDAAAYTAKALGFDAFTSSLLYSRRQDHQGMREAGEQAAETFDISFLYQDFRPLWQDGIAASKDLGIYRQQYCGCVFSEQERYARDLAKIQGA